MLKCSLTMVTAFPHQSDFESLCWTLKLGRFHIDLFLVADRLMVRALPPMKALKRYLSRKDSFTYNSEFMLVLSRQGLSLCSIAQLKLLEQNHLWDFYLWVKSVTHVGSQHLKNKTVFYSSNRWSFSETKWTFFFVSLFLLGCSQTSSKSSTAWHIPVSYSRTRRQKQTSSTTSHTSKIIGCNSFPEDRNSFLSFPL